MLLKAGLNIKHFGEHVDTCLIAEGRNFINDYVVKNIYNKSLPVPYSEVFFGDDYIKQHS